MSDFLLAVSFLTVIPGKGDIFDGEEGLRRSLYYYPIVGLGIGGMLAILSSTGSALGLGPAGDALTVVVWIMVTGGLHVDGLMDTADGLLGGRTRERKLEIMRDSRVGAMGVAAFGSVLALKITLLSSISTAGKIGCLLLAPAAGRWAMVLAVSLYPYAREGKGLGSGFTGAGVPHAAVTTVIFGAAAWAVLGKTGLAIALFVFAWTAGISGAVKRVLGGLTGDTYGAICELTETWTLLLAALLA